MTTSHHQQHLGLRDSAPAFGYGPLYALRTARAWWYSAWLRTLARFSRTHLGSIWLGLSNLLSVALLSVVYGAVLDVPNPFAYAIYLGLGLTIWTLLSQSVTSGCLLLTVRRDHLVNNPFPAVFYCLEEWAFQMQTFMQAFLFVLLALAFIDSSILANAALNMWLPLLNLFLFCLWAIMIMALFGARFKDVGQLVPILLQLLFLLSPILYTPERISKVAFLADFNLLYRVLSPLRMAVIDGYVSIPGQLVSLLVNSGILLIMLAVFKRLRYRLPLWV